MYDAARFFNGDVERLGKLVNPPKNADLYNTSSFRSFFLNLDHHQRSPLVIVGELVHTTIPKVQQAFEVIKKEGASFSDDSPGVQFLKAVIESQVLKGCDYLDCNVDEAGGGDQELAKKLMTNTIRLIVEHGQGTPPCIDSSDVEVLRAGIEEYYRLAPNGAPMPMVNSANAENLDSFWDLLSIGSIKAVYMLMESSLSAGSTGQYVTPENMLEGALTFFREATKRGFRPEQIFFDTTVMPHR